ESSIGMGIRDVNIGFKDNGGNRGGAKWAAGSEQPLFTGRHQVAFTLEGGVSAGKYNVDSLSCWDIKGNYKYYDVAAGNLPMSATALEITGAGITPKPQSIPLEGFRLLTTSGSRMDDFQAELTFGGTEAVKSVDLIFKHKTTGREIAWYARCVQPLEPGTYILDFINNGVVNDLGEYDMISISIGGATLGKSSSYSVGASGSGGKGPMPAFAQGVVYTRTADTLAAYKAPKVTGASVATQSVQSPGKLDVDFTFEVDERSGGLVQLQVAAQPEGGGLQFSVSGNVFYDTSGLAQKNPGQGLVGGSARVSFQLPAGITAAKYEIVSISMTDGRKVAVEQKISDPASWPFGTLLFTVAQGETFDLNGSLSDPKLAEKLAALPEGSSAIVENTYSSVVSAAVLEAIRGKDIRLVVECSITYPSGIHQFELNGKDITGDVKDLDLSFTIEQEKGADYGQGDEAVYVLRFPNNGQLPCPITLKLATGFVLYMPSFDPSQMYFSYIDADGNPVRERVVAQNQDGYTEIVLTHMSEFMLSQSPTPYAITATAGAGGSISPEGAVYVQQGGSQAFTFTPDSGYEVDTVTVDGVAVTVANNSYTIEDVQKSMAIHVTFKAVAVAEVTTSDTTSSVTSPKTGDETNLSLYIALCIMAGVAILGVATYRRRKTQ
ncbi:hypothetical protein LJC56_10660, partial [Christensenellaceae bacterium OttesenSCG-928-K19]|nr:hypothetical protein [Christensenellaceae bacterium OttesenSCG-928-K19]